MNVFYTNRKDFGFWIIAFLIFLVSVGVGAVVNYPPTREQLFVPTINVWWFRIMGVLMIGGGIVYYAKTLKLLDTDDVTLKAAIIIMAASPQLLRTWMGYPGDALKWLGVMAVIYVYAKTGFKSKMLAIVFAVVAVVGIVGNGKEAGLVKNLNVSKYSTETNEKFSREDSLIDRVDLPLSFRRIAYNKYSLMTSGLLKEMIAYFNIEDVFYQEMNPNSRKGMVVFFWPTIVPFFVGLAVIGRSKNGRLRKLAVILALIGFVDFMFEKSVGTDRYIMTIPAVSLTAAIGLISMKKYWPLYAVIIFLMVYGWQMFWRDFAKRPDYWLDNRPLVYQFIFNNIKAGQEAVVSSRAGDAMKYCRYYLNDCSGVKTESFELKKIKAEPGVVYAGMAGEFLGQDANNNFGDNIEARIEKEGYRIINSQKVRDSVVYGYGELVVVGEKL